MFLQPGKPRIHERSVRIGDPRRGGRTRLTRWGRNSKANHRSLAGQPLLARTLGALIRAAPGATVLPVIHKDDLDLYRTSATQFEADLVRLARPVFGGTTRQASVRLGLEALSVQQLPPAIVLIDDAARLFVSGTLVQRAVAAAKTHGAAIPGVALTDTIKEIDTQASVVATAPRARLRGPDPAGVPFRSDLGRASTSGLGGRLGSHRRCRRRGVGRASRPRLRRGSIEHEGHLRRGPRRGRGEADGHSGRFRIGQGYDVHAFGPGGHIWLGGLKIEHDHGLVGYSDADVLSHAITDALLAPWRMAISAAISRRAIRNGAARRRGFSLPPRPRKCARAAASLPTSTPPSSAKDRRWDHTATRSGPASPESVEIPLDRVALKATTSEGLGFTGREEGIAALAVATIRLPLS